MFHVNTNLKVSKSYTLIENVIGKKVQNLDLKEHVQQKVIVHIIAEVQKHKLLIFKNQGTLPAEEKWQFEDGLTRQKLRH